MCKKIGIMGPEENIYIISWFQEINYYLANNYIIFYAIRITQAFVIQYFDTLPKYGKNLTLDVRDVYPTI